MSFLTKSLAFGAILLCFGAVCFFPFSSQQDFSLKDDQPFLKVNEGETDWMDLPLATFQWQADLGFLNPIACRIVNAALHVVVIMGVFCFCDAAILAFLSGLVFSIHPAAIESVFHIAQRFSIIDGWIAFSAMFVAVLLFGNKYRTPVLTVHNLVAIGTAIPAFALVAARSYFQTIGKHFSFDKISLPNPVFLEQWGRNAVGHKLRMLLFPVSYSHDWSTPFEMTWIETAFYLFVLVLMFTTSWKIVGRPYLEGKPVLISAAVLIAGPMLPIMVHDLFICSGPAHWHPIDTNIYVMLCGFALLTALFLYSCWNFAKRLTKDVFVAASSEPVKESGFLGELWNCVRLSSSWISSFGLRLLVLIAVLFYLGFGGLRCVQWRSEVALARNDVQFAAHNVDLRFILANSEFGSCVLATEDSIDKETKQRCVDELWMVVQIDSSHLPARSQLGKVLLSMERYTEAKDVLGRCWDNQQCRFDFAVASLKSLSFSLDRLQAISETLQETEKSLLVGIIEKIAADLLAEHNFLGVSAAYRAAAAIQPDNAIFNYHVSLYAMANPEYDADLCAKYLLRALELDPGYFDAQLQLGSLYQRAGLLKEAAAAYTKCFALRPYHPQATYNSAVLLHADNQCLASLRFLSDQVLRMDVLDLEFTALKSHAGKFMNIFPILYQCWEAFEPRKVQLGESSADALVVMLKWLVEAVQDPNLTISAELRAEALALATEAAKLALKFSPEVKPKLAPYVRFAD